MSEKSTNCDGKGCDKNPESFLEKTHEFNSIKRVICVNQ